MAGANMRWKVEIPGAKTKRVEIGIGYFIALGRISRA